MKGNRKQITITMFCIRMCTNIYNILLKFTHGVLLNHIYGFRKKGNYIYWEHFLVLKLSGNHECELSTFVFLWLATQYSSPEDKWGQRTGPACCGYESKFHPTLFRKPHIEQLKTTQSHLGFAFWAFAEANEVEK